MSGVRGTAHTPIVEVARAVLENSGHLRSVHPDTQGEFLDAVLEDEYAIVGLAEFPSVASLLGGWMDAQDELASVMSRAVASTHSKAWDGYLVLVTRQASRPQEAAMVAEVRSNTRRLRKLVILGEDLGVDEVAARGGVKRGLAPLLPLDLPVRSAATNPLAGLAARLDWPGLSIEDVEVVVNAYELGLSPLGALHARLTKGAES